MIKNTNKIILSLSTSSSPKLLFLKNNNNLNYLFKNFSTTNNNQNDNNNNNNNNNNNLKSIKGTYDYFPNDKKIYNYINQIGKNVSELYGFEEISTPIIEPFELFNRSVGEYSDIVMKEMFTFKDLSDQTICLRPEGTAGVIRAINNEGSTNPTTSSQRYYYSGPMFRYERPQRGRQRQFEQFGVELVGDSNAKADVEIIDMAYHFIEKLGIAREEFILKINSLGDQESIKIYNDALEQFYKTNIDRLSPDSIKRLQRGNSLRILDSKDKNDIEINKSAPLLKDYLSTTCKERFNQVLHGLNNLGIPYQVDNGLVRGLDYYRHTIFEIIIKKDNLAILGGGRYDGLANKIGYKHPEPLPSIGWASGIDRILIYINKNLIPQKTSPIGIVIGNPKFTDNAMNLCSRLRKNGFYTMLPSFKLDEENMTKQLKKISKLSPNYVIILGEDEMNQNSVCIKNMNDRTQELVKFNEIEKYLTLNKLVIN